MLCVEYNVSGVSSDGDTPDLIPNSVVKPFNADDTWSQPAPGNVGRCRVHSIQLQQKTHLLVGVFFINKKYKKVHVIVRIL